MNTLNLFDNKVKVGISELSDGNMRFFNGSSEKEIQDNQRSLAASIGSSKTARLCTTYGDDRSYADYEILDKKNFSSYDIMNPESTITVTDGLATQEGIGILLPLADCLGVVLFDPEHNVLGLVHSGRQNLEQNGLKLFVEFLQDKFQTNPRELRAFFSPCAQDYKIYKFEKTLPQVAEEQLEKMGVDKKNILKSSVDTVSNQNYPSHSQKDSTTRFAIVAKLSV